MRKGCHARVTRITANCSLCFILRYSLVRPLGVFDVLSGDSLARARAYSPVRARGRRAYLYITRVKIRDRSYTDIGPARVGECVSSTIEVPKFRPNYGLSSPIPVALFFIRDSLAIK